MAALVPAWCDFGYDPTTRALVNRAWVAHSQRWHIQFVRTPIRTSALNTMPTALLLQAVETWQAGGVDVHGVFDAGFLPTQLRTDLHTNMPLNRSGDTFTNDYIDGVTLRAEGVGKMAHAYGLRSVIWWNEPNTLLVSPGERVAPGAKGGALAPSIAAAMYWQGCSRLASTGLAVWAGALSLLPQTGLNSRNGYYAAWLREFYETLAQHGRHAPYPWVGWCLNMEGSWTAQTCNSALAVLRQMMTRYGDKGKIRITEWGWGNGHGVDRAEAHQTLSAFAQSEVDSACFYQGPGQDPYLGDPALYTGKGAFSWRQDATRFIPEGDYLWAPVLDDEFAVLTAAARGASAQA